MPERSWAPLPLYFDRIRDLADQLEDSTEAVKFLETYLGMLPGRLERILKAIHERDEKASADAILSLKTTSSMTGALSTEARCLELELFIDKKQFDLALTSARHLASEVAVLCDYAPALMREARGTWANLEVRDTAPDAA